MGAKRPKCRVYIYALLVCLFVCLFVCLYPINVKTAEPIGPKFFVGSHVTPGKIYESSKLKKISVKKIFIFVKFKMHRKIY